MAQSGAADADVSEAMVPPVRCLGYAMERASAERLPGMEKSMRTCVCRCAHLCKHTSADARIYT